MIKTNLPSSPKPTEKIDKKLVIAIAVATIAIVIVVAGYLVVATQIDFTSDIKLNIPTGQSNKKDTPKISFMPSAAQVKAGDDLTILVNLDNGQTPQLSALEFRPEYDSNIFSKIEVTRSTILENADKAAAYVKAGPNIGKIMVYGLNQNKIGGGEIMKITLSVKSDAVLGQTSIGISDVLTIDPDAKAVKSIYEGTAVTIVE